MNSVDQTCTDVTCRPVFINTEFEKTRVAVSC
jgi:hypothetical protein